MAALGLELGLGLPGLQGWGGAGGALETSQQTPLTLPKGLMLKFPGV